MLTSEDAPSTHLGEQGQEEEGPELLRVPALPFLPIRFDLYGVLLV
jgi:hypothetical protein